MGVATVDLSPCGGHRGDRVDGLAVHAQQGVVNTAADRPWSRADKSGLVLDQINQRREGCAARQDEA